MSAIRLHDREHADRSRCYCEGQGLQVPAWSLKTAAHCPLRVGIARWSGKMMRVGGRSNQRFRNSSSRARYEDHRFPSSISVEYKVVDQICCPSICVSQRHACGFLFNANWVAMLHSCRYAVGASGRRSHPSLVKSAFQFLLPSKPSCICIQQTTAYS